MKKYWQALTIVSVMILGVAAYAQETETTYGNKTMMGLKLGLDTAGESTIANGGLDADRDVDAGASLGWEYTYFFNDLGLGGGIVYQIPRALKDAEGKFYFVPLYALARYEIPMNEVTIYGIGQLGYNYYAGDSSYKQGADLSGGLYWGAGAGATFLKRYQIEVLYSESRGTFETPGTGTTYSATTTTNPPDGFYYARASAPSYVLSNSTSYDITYRIVTISLGINFALPLNK